MPMEVQAKLDRLVKTLCQERSLGDGVGAHGAARRCGGKSWRGEDSYPQEKRINIDHLRQF
jgi:hypothetical protein